MAGHVVKVSVVADTRRAQRAFTQLAETSGFSALASRAQSAGAALAKLGAAAAAASAAGAAALGALAVKAVSAASDLEQSMGGMEAVFKDAAGQMKDFAKAAHTSVGLSTNSYSSLATLLGAQLKNAGTPIQELAGKTNDLIKVGADLAAQFGGSTQDAVAALSSALKGERDPIERYGVSLRQAAIDARAAELGFSKVGGSFDQQAQSAATLSLIMEQTTDAQGAFARESDTLAHKIQVAKATVEDFAARMGTALLPIVNKAADWLTTHLLPAAESLATWFETKGVPAIEQAAQYFQTNVLPVLSDFAQTFHEKILPALKTVAEFILTQVVPAVGQFAQFLITDVIPAIVSASQWIREHGVVVAALVGPIVAVMAAWRAYKTTLAAINAAQAAYRLVTTLTTTAKTAYVFGTYGQITAEGSFLTVSSGVIGALRTKVAVMGQTVAAGARMAASWLAQRAAAAAHLAIMGAQRLAMMAAAAAQWALNAAMSANPIGIVVAAIAALVGALILAWNKSETFRAVVTTVWEAIKNGVSNAVSFVSALISTAVAWISGNWSSGWNGIVSFVTGAWDKIKNGVSTGIDAAVNFVKQLPSRALSALGNIGDTLLNAGQQLIQGFIDGIGNMFGKVRDKLGSLTEKLTSWKGPESLDKKLLTPAGQYVIDGFIRGLESRYADVRKTLGALTRDISNTDMGELSAPRISALAAGAPSASSSPALSVTVNVQALAPSPEIGRQVSQALEQWWALNGRRGVSYA